MKKGRGALTLLLIFWTIFALFSFLENANRIIGKSFVTSDEFEWEVNSYYRDLYENVLITFDTEMAKKQIKVSKEEIRHYRNYYGSLEEQVENIVSQYDYRLQDEGLSDEVKEVVKQERDRKIEEIKKNFADEAHVEAKIRLLKEQIIDNYAEEKERVRRNFLASSNYKMFSYDLVNIDTGQRFLYNSTDVPAIFFEKFPDGDENYFPPVLTGSYEYTSGGWTEEVNSSTSTRMDTEIYMDGAFEESFALLDGSIPITLEQPKFTGTIALPKAALKNTELKRNYEGFETFKTLTYFIWVTGVITLLLLIFLIRSKKTGLQSLLPKEKSSFRQLPIDSLLILVLVGGLFSIKMIEMILSTLYQVSYSMGNGGIAFVIDLVMILAIAVPMFTVTFIGAIWLMDGIRDVERWKNAMFFHIWQAGQDVFLNRSIGIQVFAMLIIFFLAGIGFAGAMVQTELFVIYIPLFLFVLIPTLYIFLRRMGYLNRVMKQTEDMAEGRLTSDVEVTGKSPIAEHAKNLNKLRDGVRTSMTEQAKSERLKTELITNVSHDLRTPLTSIITYTDLLKKPDLSEEERSKYIDILDKKSARLKTLIEDLFDVSKMASGNVELLKQRVDLAQLLQQAIGEHEEAFVTANLDMRINIESQPIFAYVDGQKWWRIIDNLIVNAQKYSLEGTRVYITLKQQGAEAELIVKNVAKYELAENVEELTERFKRADTSRHTEGSGLGLAIAQSIVDLHGARMKIEVDGDLFKVTVAVQVAY
ncbi:HAMP domain-containing sensor histidine kinase [Metasolibacillus meyeri]|uniref:histidine kinase n=1 Tax=Metasolibacillus meyeri TaxID=1071052 RepID=A0AAW9NVJ2_9BACL|nr:HAMP domain-containing sensor histidine kinase [Metasolibacillus meyeri]MEC1178585.1 HAMP domain-containing sensor histidine kinase [Metasolibacillus meyeri]